MDSRRNIVSLQNACLAVIINVRFLRKKENAMKKVMLALFAVLTLSACMGHYKQGNCEYDFLLHKDISISKWIGAATGC